MATAIKKEFYKKIGITAKHRGLNRDDAIWFASYYKVRNSEGKYIALSDCFIKKDDGSFVQVKHLLESKGYSIGQILDEYQHEKLHFPAPTGSTSRDDYHQIDPNELEFVLDISNAPTIEPKKNSSTLRVVKLKSDTAKTNPANYKVEDYILIDFGGSSPLRRVQISDIKDKDGKPIVLPGTYTSSDESKSLAELSEKLGGSESSWYYNSVEIKTIYIGEVTTSEPTKYCEEVIKATTLNVERTLATGVTSDDDANRYLSVLISEPETKANVTISTGEYTTKEESTTSGVKKVPVLKLKNYTSVPMPEATHIKVTLEGETQARMIPISNVVGNVAGDKKGTSAIDTGAKLKVKLGTIDVETLPLEEEQAKIGFAPNMTYAKTETNFDPAKQTFLRTKSGEYVDEKKVAAPISFKKFKGDVAADWAKIKYFAEMDADGVWHIRTLDEMKAKDSTFDHTKLSSSILALEECAFEDKPDFVQVTNSGANRIAKVTNSEIEREKARQEFLELYKKGDYALDHIWEKDPSNNFVSKEIIAGSRYNLTDEIEIEDTLANKEDFAAYTKNPISFVVDKDTGAIVTYRGGVEASAAKMNKDLWQEFGSWCGLGLVGMVVCPPVGILLAPAMAIGAAGLGLWNVGKSVWNAVKKVPGMKKLDKIDKLEALRDDFKKNKIDEYFKSLGRVQAEDLTDSLILKRIEELESEIEIFSQFEIDNSVKIDPKTGRVIVTENNMDRAYEFQKMMEDGEGKTLRDANKKYKAAIKALVKAYNKKNKKDKIQFKDGKFVKIDGGDEVKFKTIEDSLGASKVVTDYDTAKRNFDAAKKSFDSKVDEFSRPESKLSSDEKENMLKKTDNLRVYWLLKNAKVFGDKLTFDTGTGELKVGQYKVVKNGDEYVLEDLGSGECIDDTEKATLIELLNDGENAIAKKTTKKEEKVENRRIDWPTKEYLNELDDIRKKAMAYMNCLANLDLTTLSTNCGFAMKDSSAVNKDAEQSVKDGAIKAEIINDKGLLETEYAKLKDIADLPDDEKNIISNMGKAVAESKNLEENFGNCRIAYLDGDLNNFEKDNIIEINKYISKIEDSLSGTIDSSLSADISSLKPDTIKTLLENVDKFDAESYKYGDKVPDDLAEVIEKVKDIKSYNFEDKLKTLNKIQTMNTKVNTNYKKARDIEAYVNLLERVILKVKRGDKITAEDENNAYEDLKNNSDAQAENYGDLRSFFDSDICKNPLYREKFGEEIKVIERVMNDYNFARKASEYEDVKNKKESREYEIKILLADLKVAMESVEEELKKEPAKLDINDLPDTKTNLAKYKIDIKSLREKLEELGKLTTEQNNKLQSLLEKIGKAETKIEEELQSRRDAEKELKNQRRKDLNRIEDIKKEVLIILTKLKALQDKKFLTVAEINQWNIEKDKLQKKQKDLQAIKFDVEDLEAKGYLNKAENLIKGILFAMDKKDAYISIKDEIKTVRAKVDQIDGHRKNIVKIKNKVTKDKYVLNENDKKEAKKNKDDANAIKKEIEKLRILKVELTGAYKTNLEKCLEDMTKKLKNIEDAWIVISAKFKVVVKKNTEINSEVKLAELLRGPEAAKLIEYLKSNIPDLTEDDINETLARISNRHNDGVAAIKGSKTLKNERINKVLMYGAQYITKNAKSHGV